MIKMDKKEQILHYYRVDGLSLREISRRVGLNRKTVTRYVREFEKMSLQDVEDGVERCLLQKSAYSSCRKSELPHLNSTFKCNSFFAWLIHLINKTNEQSDIIIYNTTNGKASVALYVRDGKIWLNHQQMAELFGTSNQSISHHVINILKEKELDASSVVKHYLTTAADGKCNCSWIRLIFLIV